jgi:hypothetical protein
VGWPEQPQRTEIHAGFLKQDPTGFIHVALYTTLYNDENPTSTRMEPIGESGES